MKIEDIAKICHQANKAYCESLGDTSQVNWEEAEDWQRKSAINGVTKIYEGEITDVGEAHESWLAEKKADGWVYGLVKDAAAKEHPCMVKFHDLPEEQRLKDVIFFSIADSLLMYTNFR